MGDDASFGRWVTSRRKTMHVTRAELARRVSCATVTLRKIEEDARRPSLELAARLALHLGVAEAGRQQFVSVARGERPVASLPPPAQLLSTSQGPERGTGSSDGRQPPATNLPAYLTSFIGRHDEMVSLTRAVTSERLVTLTGPGGVGKTRLAIEACIQLRQTGSFFPDGIWLVELASLSQPSLVPAAIANAAKLPENSLSSVRAFEDCLADKSLLLLLDNCEHLIQPCAEIVQKLLSRCWDVHVVTTSREQLRLPGELVFRVPPLSVPRSAARTRDQLLDGAAVDLFRQRMDEGRLRDHSLEEATTLASICRKLEGLPLALELAAPLTQTMSLPEMADQLDDQMALLNTTYRAVPDRHQTMQRALAWSYQLLTPGEQRLLAAVSVFAGGGTLSAMRVVCADPMVSDLDTALERLVTKSLVSCSQLDGHRRYRLLEPVRQFAHAELVGSGAAPAVRLRHARYYLGLAERMDAARDTPEERGWLRTLEPERDNVRAVNAWALEHQEVEFAHRFNGALFAFWIYCSRLTEAEHWLSAVLAMRPSSSGPTRSALSAQILALDAAGYAAVLHRNYREAEDRFQTELTLCREMGDSRGVATALRGCGFTAMLTGDLASARRLAEESLALCEATHDAAGVAWSLFDIGYVALVEDDRRNAQILLQKAVWRLSSLGISFGLFRAYLALGHVGRAAHDAERARTYYRKALQLQQQMGYSQYAAEGLEGLAGLAAAEEPLRAAQLFGAAHALRRKVAMPRWQHLEARYERDVALAGGRLRPEQWRSAWEAGSAMPLDAAAKLALAL